MQRYFLAKGDRAGAAYIVEGLPMSTWVDADGAPIPLATVYMKTWCDACKREGYVSPRGPRHPGSAENGRPFALSGDVNSCACGPQPVFQAVRALFQSIDAVDIARMSPADARLPLHDESRAGSWIGFHLRGEGSFEGALCVAHFEDGSVETGRLDLSNAVCWGRSNDSACTRVDVSPPDVESDRSVTEALLRGLLE